jgi:hypothetical protein
LSALETSGEIKKGMDTQFVMSFNCFSISIRGNSWSAHLRVCPSLSPPSPHSWPVIILEKKNCSQQRETKQQHPPRLKRESLKGLRLITRIHQPRHDIFLFFTCNKKRR